MKNVVLLCVATAAFVIAAIAFGFAAPAASAHRSWCHSRHTCPGDHATYRWRGLLCVKPTADERNSTFRKKIRYGGRLYYCKR
jgi:hypothetical protein